ncbi:uncharacterized protein LOC121238255 [Juglans microcarpa x Juglans regia]|uniref:uncharacterized protein LOC121238255 n=1 Tax=Juglans microcarpa x Juglans regia TaxID=2249226 RepID=UPI001B7F56DF|nr:uncharacterized protein LOC121238255 [Juglans microcarpa x Juglans regia]
MKLVKGGVNMIEPRGNDYILPPPGFIREEGIRDEQALRQVELNEPLELEIDCLAKFTNKNTINSIKLPSRVEIHKQIYKLHVAGFHLVLLQSSIGILFGDIFRESVCPVFYWRDIPPGNRRYIELMMLYLSKNMLIWRYRSLFLVLCAAYIFSLHLLRFKHMDTTIYV